MTAPMRVARAGFADGRTLTVEIAQDGDEITMRIEGEGPILELVLDPSSAVLVGMGLQRASAIGAGLQARIRDRRTRR